MKRGEVWWASLGSPAGSGPGNQRPVLVVQAEPFNESRISTVVVAVITSNLALAEAPGNVRLGVDSGLPKPSVVNVSQLLTLDRELLTEKLEKLPSKVMEQVNLGLRLVLAL